MYVGLPGGCCQLSCCSISCIGGIGNLVQNLFEVDCVDSKGLSV